MIAGVIFLVIGNVFMYYDYALIGIFFGIIALICAILWSWGVRQEWE